MLILIYTEAYQNHTDRGYEYKVVCCYDDKYSKPLQVYRGGKAVYKFIQQMLHEVHWSKNTMKMKLKKTTLNDRRK